MAKTAEKKKRERGPRKYKLLPGAGPHFEPNVDFDPTIAEDDDENPRDVMFEAGDVVTSSRPLDKLFVNKFRKVGGDEEDDRPSQVGGQALLDPEDDPDKDRPVRSTEMATRKEAGRFLEEDEVEDKKNTAELKKLVRGEGAKKKSVLEDEEDEDSEESVAESDEDEEESVEAGEDTDDSDEDEPPARRPATKTARTGKKRSKK